MPVSHSAQAPNLETNQQTDAPADEEAVESLDQVRGAVYEVVASQLPLACPMPDSELWNMHPRVYLDIETTGKVSCPYCGAQYRLVDS